jgi:hypothetical protein
LQRPPCSQLPAPHSTKTTGQPPPDCRTADGKLASSLCNDPPAPRPQKALDRPFLFQLWAFPRIAWHVLFAAPPCARRAMKKAQQQRQRLTPNLMAWRAGFTSMIPTDPRNEKSASAELHFSCNWASELSGSFSKKEKRRTPSPARTRSALATTQAPHRAARRSRTQFPPFFLGGAHNRKRSEQSCGPLFYFNLGLRLPFLLPSV